MFDFNTCDREKKTPNGAPVIVFTETEVNPNGTAAISTVRGR